MCGIFGFTVQKGFPLFQKAGKTAEVLYELSETRGKEASGFSINNGQEIHTYKTSLSAKTLVKSKTFKKSFNQATNTSKSFVSLIGHSRLVTNGDENNNKNNQPVIKHGSVTIHNGIIVNHSEIWAKLTSSPESELDSEIIPELIKPAFDKGVGPKQAFDDLYKEIYGMASIAMMLENSNDLVLSTNNGSLYFISCQKDGLFAFASEQLILTELLKRLGLAEKYTAAITQLLPEETIIVKDTGEWEYTNSESNLSTSKIKKTIEIPFTNNKVKNNSLYQFNEEVPDEFLLEIERISKKIAALKRCSKCLLPESFPYIEYDDHGECNYCKNYSPINPSGKEGFKDLLYKYKSDNKRKHDCLIPLSGGRDSCFTIHYVKEVLGMNPIAFSYDWGMLTDLSRRNQSRMCGKLKVEHILISADIRKKRKNIHKNVKAWLHKPHLGTIPLFMAGDKQYFYHANQLMKQNNLPLSIMGENMLETTRFKSGFAGIKPNFGSDHTYTLTKADKVKMMMFYGKEYLTNPKYINSSLVDTLDAFKSYYVMDHKNLNIFDHLPWIEDEVESTLLDNYDWEIDPETPSTWRIGDGTAAFYNYIYYVVAGFTENDTFRSNQIREGLIDRETAVKKIEVENKPRWQSLQWYCKTIDIDWKEAIKIINKIEKLF